MLVPLEGYENFSGTPKATCRQRFPMLFFWPEIHGKSPKFVLSQFKWISVSREFFFFEGVCRESMTMTMTLTMMILNVMFFFQFFWMFLFLYGCDRTFFSHFLQQWFRNQGQQGWWWFISGAVYQQLKWVNLWNGCEKPKPFSSLKSSDTDIQLGGGFKHSLLFIPLFSWETWSNEAAHSFRVGWGFNHLKGSNPSLKWDQDLLSKVFHANFQGPFLLDAHLFPLLITNKITSSSVFPKHFPPVKAPSYFPLQKGGVAGWNHRQPPLCCSGQDAAPCNFSQWTTSKLYCDAQHDG